MIMYSRVALQRPFGMCQVPWWRRQRLLPNHPVPPGRIPSFYAIPGTSCLATLMRPSGTISCRAIKT